MNNPAFWIKINPVMYLLSSRVKVGVFVTQQDSTPFVMQENKRSNMMPQK